MAQPAFMQRCPASKGNSNSHGARPVHPIITMIKWTRTQTLHAPPARAADRPSPPSKIPDNPQRHPARPPEGRALRHPATRGGQAGGDAPASRSWRSWQAPRRERPSLPSSLSLLRLTTAVGETRKQSQGPVSVSGNGEAVFPAETRAGLGSRGYCRPPSLHPSR